MRQRLSFLHIVPAIVCVAVQAQAQDTSTSQASATAPAQEIIDPILRPVGWQRYASRFMHPPVLRFDTVPGAAEYRATIQTTPYRADHRDSADMVHPIKSLTPALDFAPVWQSLMPGAVSASLAAVDREGKVLATRELLFHKARTFDGTIPSWRYSIPEVVDGVASYLVNVRSPNAVAPDRSPLVWHAIIMPDGKVNPLGYPTQNAYYIEFFIEYSKWTKDKELAQRAIALARELADFNIRYRTPADWKLPNLFYTTAVQGKMGGAADRDTLIVTLTGLMARSLLRLGLDQHEPRYIQAAVDTARCLLATQTPEGNWPFRVEPKTGRVDNAYTSSVIMPVVLLDELIAAPTEALSSTGGADLRDGFKSARSRALQWIIKEPLRDYRWEGFCEDIKDMAPYVATEWYDAGWTAKYFIQHRDEFPDQFQPALKLLDWIEDQFVCWSALDIPYLTSTNPLPAMAPAVMEQYRCYRPVDGCNSWLLECYLSAYKATRQNVYLQKARALGSALTQIRRPSGAIATWCFYANPDRPVDNGDWFNCMAYDAHMLMRYEKLLRETP